MDEHEGGDAATFASQVTAFHQTLIEDKFPDSFACLLHLSNTNARLQSQRPPEEAVPFNEVLIHCCHSLADRLQSRISSLLHALQTHYQTAKEPVQKSPSAKSRRIKSRRPAKKQTSTDRRNEKKSYAESRLAASRAGAPKPREAPVPDALPDVKQLELKGQEDDSLVAAAECCRLLTSIDVLFESLSSDSRCFPSGFDIYSTMVRAVFLSRCRLEKKELEAHRALATRTTQLGSVEAAGDDPYLKALSALLGTAHMFVHELTMGTLNVGAHERSESKQLLCDIEKHTYEFVMPVVEAIYEHREVARWVARAQGSSDSSTEEMGEEDVSRLSGVLSDMMEVQQYCLGFIEFADSVGLSGSEQLKQKSLEYVGAYVQLEMLWLDHSFKKAIDTAETQDFDGTLVNSVVDNTFYIIRVGFGRAVHTRSLHAASATANHIWFSLQEAYTAKIRSLMSSSLSQATPSHGEEEGKGPSSMQDANDRFAAALDSDIAGLGNLNVALLGAINTVELSARFCKELEEMVKEAFEENFAEKMSAIDMALRGIEEVCTSHEKLREGAIQEVVATCVTPTQRSALEAAMRKVSYQLTHSMYDGLERNDPFMNTFVNVNIHRNEPLLKCKKHLTPLNYALVICKMTEALTEAIAQHMLSRQENVNALGALRFEKDLQTLLHELASLVEDCAWSGDPAFTSPPADVIRSHFCKLKHISFLLQQPVSLAAETIEYPLDPALSDEEASIILAKRS